MSKIRCILVGPEDPRNIGAAVRAGVNFGVHDIAVVADELTPDDERLAQVASAGAWKIAGRPKLFRCIEDAVGDCSLVCGTTARERSRPGVPTVAPQAFFAGCAAGQRVAILFGPESHGLTSEQCALCHRMLRIDVNPHWSSLNLAQAVLVIAYEWWKAEQAHAASGEPTGSGSDAGPVVASVEAQERVISRVQECMGTQATTRTANAVAQLRQLLQRAEPTSEDVSMLLNIIKRTRPPE